MTGSSQSSGLDLSSYSDLIILWDSPVSNIKSLQKDNLETKYLSQVSEYSPNI